jgi:chromosome segregation protein
MRLDSVEIVGFKSFCDRQELSFKGGVTGIVGPNGCGKSNVSDAINWVLGEQSVKSLRGTSMEDVIFNGSRAAAAPDGRGEPQGLGPERQQPRRHRPSASVSRRLYRNGESEYLMNGKVCRLRDIHELFMDTGLGSQGLLDHRAGQDRPDPLVEARRPPRPHRGGRRHHEVQRAPAPDRSSSSKPRSRTCCA